VHHLVALPVDDSVGLSLVATCHVCEEVSWVCCALVDVALLLLPQAAADADTVKVDTAASKKISKLFFFIFISPCHILPLKCY
jgi:hypothetical protein